VFQAYLDIQSRFQLPLAPILYSGYEEALELVLESPLKQKIEKLSTLVLHQSNQFVFVFQKHQHPNKNLTTLNDKSGFGSLTEDTFSPRHLSKGQLVAYFCNCPSVWGHNFGQHQSLSFNLAYSKTVSGLTATFPDLFWAPSPKTDFKWAFLKLMSGCFDIENEILNNCDIFLSLNRNKWHEWD